MKQLNVCGKKFVFCWCDPQISPVIQFNSKIVMVSKYPGDQHAHTQCTMHNLKLKIHNAQGSMHIHNAQYTIYIAQCKIHDTHCTMHKKYQIFPKFTKITNYKLFSKI